MAPKKKSMLVLFLIILILLTACNRLYFHPMKKEVLTPSKLGLKYKNLYLTTPDMTLIHGWHIPAVEHKKGTVIFFHGNAQNITTHIASVHWLPKHGYEVFIFDYRGYGRSQGDPSIEGAIIDSMSILEYVINTVGEHNVIVFGQSLGGAIALNAIAQFKNKQPIKGVIIDSSFSGFRKIAREKLANIWLTWPFQYPFSLAFTSSYNPQIAASQISPTPLLIIHGNADNIIPIHHGKALFEAASPPKIFWEIEKGTHIISTTKQNIRNHLLQFIDAAINKQIAENTNQVIKLYQTDPKPKKIIHPFSPNFHPDHTANFSECGKITFKTMGKKPNYGSKLCEPYQWTRYTKKD